MEAPSYVDLANATGISRSFAHEILNTPKKPSGSLAVHIYRATGWKHPRIAGMTDDQIAAYEAMHPYTSRKPADAAVAA